MHPLAMPTVVAAGAFALSTVWATFVFGMPVVHKSLFGRIALGSLALVYVGNVALWGLRWLGYFGGPVPV
jgi:hypothetical protein